MPLRELAERLEQEYPNKVVYSPRLFEVFDALNSNPTIPHSILSLALQPGSQPELTRRGISFLVEGLLFSIHCSQEIAVALLLLSTYTDQELPAVAAGGQVASLKLGTHGFEVVQPKSFRVFDQELPHNVRLFPQNMTIISYLELLFPNYDGEEIFAHCSYDAEASIISINSPISADPKILTSSDELYEPMLRLMTATIKNPYQIGIEFGDQVVYRIAVGKFLNARTGAIVRLNQVLPPEGFDLESLSLASTIIKEYSTAKFVEENDPQSSIILSTNSTSGEDVIEIDNSHPLYSAISLLVSSSLSKNEIVGTTTTDTGVFFTPNTGFMMMSLQERPNYNIIDLLRNPHNPLRDISAQCTLLENTSGGQAKYFLLKPGADLEPICESDPRFTIFKNLMEKKVGLLKIDGFDIFVYLSKGAFVFTTDESVRNQRGSQEFLIKKTSTPSKTVDQPRKSTKKSRSGRREEKPGHQRSRRGR